jgi:hypothetical protein
MNVCPNCGEENPQWGHKCPLPPEYPIYAPSPKARQTNTALRVLFFLVAAVAVLLLVLTTP